MKRQNLLRWEIDAIPLDLFVVDLTQEQRNYKRPALVYKPDPVSRGLLTISIVNYPVTNEQNDSPTQQEQTPLSADTDCENEEGSRVDEEC